MLVMNMDSALSRRMMVHWGLVHQAHMSNAVNRSRIDEVHSPPCSALM